MIAVRPDRYTVFGSYDVVDLQDDVTEAIYNGWVPIGGVSCVVHAEDPDGRTIYRQALWMPEVPR